MKTILLTGAGGYIGSNAAEYFTRAGYRVVGTVRRKIAERLSRLGVKTLRADLTDAEAIARLFDEKPDYVVHFRRCFHGTVNIRFLIPPCMRSIRSRTTLTSPIVECSPGLPLRGWRNTFRPSTRRASGSPNCAVRANLIFCLRWCGGFGILRDVTPKWGGAASVPMPKNRAKARRDRDGKNDKKR